MKKRIFSVLNNLGIPCSLKGRRYIESALDIVLEKGHLLLTKELYPEIAKKCGLLLVKLREQSAMPLRSVFATEKTRLWPRFLGRP